MSHLATPVWQLHKMKNYPVAYVVQRPHVVPKKRKFGFVFAVILALVALIGLAVYYSRAVPTDTEDDNGNTSIRSNTGSIENAPPSLGNSQATLILNESETLVNTGNTNITTETTGEPLSNNPQTEKSTEKETNVTNILNKIN